nr:DUF6265 family protein [uncultured Flavobacterium sp.]
MTCNNKSNEKNSEENFDWLLGNWERLNDNSEHKTFENWYKINETEYSGTGFTLKNGDTISQEEMLLAKQNNEWNLSVSIPSNKEATVFKVTSISENTFICENQTNDFPKKIEYWFEDANLKATISNPEREIKFIFEKNKHLI